MRKRAKMAGDIAYMQHGNALKAAAVAGRNDTDMHSGWTNFFSFLPRAPIAQEGRQYALCGQRLSARKMHE
jgi:hypothetical protein